MTQNSWPTAEPKPAYGAPETPASQPAPAHDPVSHPRHYTSHPSGVECIDIVEYMNFCRGNAMKYLWRAGLKDDSDTLTDLKKARWYLDREIARLEEGTIK